MYNSRIGDLLCLIVQVFFGAMFPYHTILCVVAVIINVFIAVRYNMAGIIHVSMKVGKDWKHLSKANVIGQLTGVIGRYQYIGELSLIHFQSSKVDLMIEHIRH
jgi:hypothetical protein